MDKQEQIKEMMITLNEVIAVDAIAEVLYHAGYRKADEVRKETAKEILLQLKKDCPHNYFAVISFIVKQENIYGVEIDENDGT